MNSEFYFCSEEPVDIGTNPYPYFQIRGWLASRDADIQSIEIEDGERNLPLRLTRRVDVEKECPGYKVAGFQGVFKKSEVSNLSNLKISSRLRNGSHQNFDLKKVELPEEHRAHLPGQDLRAKLSYEYLRGEGLEIGALFNPSPFDGRLARVKYVDRLPEEELRKHYPELHSYEFAPVDIIDDGERLTRITNESVDFVIANHMLEHCEDPLMTLKSMLNKVIVGGRLFITLPDKRFIECDKEREITPFDHLVRDHTQGPEISRVEHYQAWVIGQKVPPERREEELKRLMAMQYSIHFHIWDSNAALDFILKAREYLGRPYDLIMYQENKDGGESFFVLEKKTRTS